MKRPTIQMSNIHVSFIILPRTEGLVTEFTNIKGSPTTFTVAICNKRRLGGKRPKNMFIFQHPWNKQKVCSNVKLRHCYRIGDLWLAGDKTEKLTFPNFCYH